MMGANIVKIHGKPPIPIRTTVLSPTVVWTFSSESPRPTKNGNKEVWRQVQLRLPRACTSFGSFTQVLAQSSTLQQITVPLEDMRIITNPLLNENRQERCQKTRDEGHEPESISTDIRCHWIERQVLAEWKNRNLWRDGD